jgi:hypothetical protein
MKDSRLFSYVMIGTACMGFAGHMLTADGRSEVSRPIARSLGVAVVDNCNVTGEVVRGKDGIYAVISVENPTDKPQEVAFQYAVNHKGAESFMSRMIRMPTAKKKGSHAVMVKAGATESAKILVEAIVPSTNSTDSAKIVIPLKVTRPETWNIVISKGETKSTIGFGASAPGIREAKVELVEGQLMIARTVIEVPVAVVANNKMLTL